jgi:hypothetical protein
MAAMKKAELEKLMARRISGRQPGARQRLATARTRPRRRIGREQRERDRQMGLVPFAVKLHEDLVREIHAAAQASGVGLNEGHRGADPEGPPEASDAARAAPRGYI